MFHQDNRYKTNAILFCSYFGALGERLNVAVQAKAVTHGTPSGVILVTRSANMRRKSSILVVAMSLTLLLLLLLLELNISSGRGRGQGRGRS